ncbi:hypothetical protein F5148DRAFT_1299180 [Russula earlei]|uniref:Uncharacterized protein n=1 Tax=Russula earlei TaxID=71964 RepID=A0ACC0UCF0_9AGAM|nr:hypothetical protein F5148DRAFT_1299180 [Russula earlei]
MADRQELIRNAVSFLADPKAQASPLAQRIQFLEAKGLTGPEIEEAMRQANSYGPQPLQSPFSPVYGPLPYVTQSIPPWDWRDYFITSVISGSLVYGAVALARKYLFPHLQAPSSTAYEEDRDALTAQFDAAESLLREISAETSAVKVAVENQREKVEKATADVEAAVEQMREGESRARDEMREIREEVNNIREMIPKENLQQDLKSLKTLLLSRTPNASTTSAPALPGFPPRPSIPSWQLSGLSTGPANPNPSLDSYTSPSTSVPNGTNGKEKEVEEAENVVEGLAQPRPPQASTPRSASLDYGRPSSPARSVAERHAKAKLEDRLRASFTIGEASNPSTPPTSSRVSPVPQPSHPGNSASPDVEALQERFKSMEQRVADISASLATSLAEKLAADKVLREMTSIQSCQDAEGLRDYLQNAQLKAEDEIRRLTGKLTRASDHYFRQEERIEELRETHRLESDSQIQLVDELRSQIQQNDALLKAARSSNSQLEADIAKQRGELDQLRGEVEKARALMKSEEEKCNKAINHLKTVRQRLVKTEKERDDAFQEAAAIKDGQKAEREKEQLEREKLQADLNKLKVEKEVSLADLRVHLEKELMASKQRSEKEIFALRGQFELEAVEAKSSHEYVMTQMDAQVNRLERSIQSLSTEKDNLFDQLQMRQAEVESAQSHLEVLQSQNTELQYQVRENDGRITLLNEELSDLRQAQYFGTSDPSTSPEEVAKLLAAAEARHETKLSVLKQKLASMEAERIEVEAEWRRKVETKVQEAQKWKSLVDSTSQSRQSDDDRTQELQAEVERLQSAARAHDREVSQLGQQIERLTSDEETIKQQLAEQVMRISTLDHQLEESTVKEHQARAHNKALREELRKVQSSAALLDRQRGPGLGYWSSASATDVVSASVSPASSQPPGSSRPDSPVAKNHDEDVNLEYLRNVILQFLEHKEMRPNLVRVLSTILRFTPQETRRLIAKV